MNVTLQSAVVAADVQRINACLKVFGQLQGQHLLISGSTGFFGKWLLASLALLNQQGANITVTAISRSPSRFLKQCPEYANPGWLTWLEGDVQSLSHLALAHVDLVLHAATDTLAGAHASPLRIFDTIVNGARNVLELAVRSGARRVLFTGSGAQYGALEYGQPVSETSTCACNSLLAGSVYGEAKRAQETLAALYAEQHALEVILTRCFAFSGPGIVLDGHFAIGNFVRDALWHDELVLQSSGQAVRSYLHGADLAGWLLTLLVSGVAGEAYNVGSDKGLTIADLARKVMGRIAPHKPLKILGQDGEAKAQSYYVPAVEKARALGLDDWTSLDESIDSMARWVREQNLSTH